VVGYTWTQITKGLTKGAQVILAEMAQPLPGAATATKSSNSTTQSNGANLPPGLTNGRTVTPQAGR